MLWQTPRKAGSSLPCFMLDCLAVYVSTALLSTSRLTLVGGPFFSIEHPFLLADNRHYTFYVWRKIYRRHWTAPYLSTPLYVFAFSAIFDRLGE
jgi:alpha-1,2-glucosyltransferase